MIVKLQKTFLVLLNYQKSLAGIKIITFVKKVKCDST